MATGTENRITLRSVLLGVLLTAWFATIMVRGEWRHGHYTGTQIPLLPYAMLFLLVFAINPLLHWIRAVRPFTRAELLVVFVMGMVPAGIPSMGLATHMVPVMSSLFWSAGNNDQSRWDIYVEPYMNPRWFVGGQPGLREAAVRLRDADAEWRAARDVYTVARTLSLGHEQVESAAALMRQFDAAPPGEVAPSARQAAERRALAAEAALKRAEEWWEPYSKSYTTGDVLRDFPARLETLEREQKARLAQLDALETNAFLIVEQFRRGLPKETQRALPGFFKVLPGMTLQRETWGQYSARLERMLQGLRSLGALRRAETCLRKADKAGAAPGPELASALQEAIRELEPICNTNAVAARQAEIEQDLAPARATAARVERQRVALQRYRRYANATEIRALDKLLDELTDTGKDTDVALRKGKDEVNALSPLLLAARQAILTRDALRELLSDVQAQPGAKPAELRHKLSKAMAGYSTFDASWQRFWVGEIPWGAWFGPLVRWISLVLTLYVLLMAFNILIFRQWAHHEKIVYPLAELPETVAGARDAEPGLLPAIFRQGLFWCGFGISAVVLGWLYYVRGYGQGVIPMEWDLSPYIEGSIFDGLRPWTRLRIFFTLIGLTFLVPARISYSLWFFHVIQMLQLLALVWLGYGVNEGSFPTDWNSKLNFTTAQGGGALLVFSIVMLWKVRATLVCGPRPSVVADLEPGERAELRAASWTFLTSSLLFIAILNRGLGTSLPYCVLYYVFILAITIGLVRAVTEGGLLSVKCWFGPFHFIRSAFGMNHAWTAPALFSPLFVFHSVLFMAYEVMIAPCMANALKIRDDLKLRRPHFHAALALGILATCAVGVLTHILVAYSWGADCMHQWFYRGVPFTVFEAVKSMNLGRPFDTDGSGAWMAVGAVAMGLLLYFRGRVFWLPHPIGLVMFVNPAMNAYWFSILLGWLFKVLVSTYGNKDTYARVRSLFIGLIVGELILCALAGHALDSPSIWAR